MQGHIDAWCIPSRTTGVPGIETYAEEGALIELALKVPEGGVIVELGGEYGRSASQFAYALKLNGHQSAKVYTVDLFPENHWFVGNLKMAWGANLRECKMLDFCTPLPGSTVAIAKYWADKFDGKPIDLLFIDAGHSYLEVKADIENWIPFVKPGGVVAFHDYAIDASSHPLHWEVRQAVLEWFTANTEGWSLGGQVDSLVWFTKPKTKTVNTTPTVAAEKTLPPTVKNKGGRPKKAVASK